jgi:uncharacterized protein YbaR (Trm112 family)
VSSWAYAEGDETPFACAACASLPGSQPLRAVRGAVACLGCGQKYPVLGGVPCLMPDPQRFRLEQLRHLQDYLFVTEARQRDIGTERRQPELLALTRERLLQLIHAMDAERALVSDVFSTLVAGLDAEAAGIVPGSAAPARDLSVLELYETVFRDWAWGESESARALALVEHLVSAAASYAGKSAKLELGRLAVFGAGACRLAADVHRTLGPIATYALDINPLPLLLAARLLGQAVVEAYEYPTGPRGLEHMAVLQQLRCSFPVPDGLLLALADARCPPFVAAGLDSVLTPWFIDVVSAELPDTIATIHRVLGPGGLWFNQGPLRFSGSAARRYCIEEVRELVQAGGFQLLAERTEDVPYFDSPHAGSRRIETVYGFVARKLARASATRAVVKPQPAWAHDVTAPIPRVPELGALQERLIFSAGALSLIDGARSLVDLAYALGEELGVEPARLVEPLRGLLLNLLAPG